MKIFLSWSGNRSKYIASCLNKWIPNMVPHMNIWFSEKDIQKGKIWFEEIQKALTDDETVCSLLCLTPENIHSDWINFEAGCFLGKIGHGGIFTLLYEVKAEDITFPLAAFQKTSLKKKDFKKMIQTLNKSSGLNKIKNNQLDYLFSNAWKELEKELKKVPKSESPEKIPDKRSDSEIIREVLATVRSMKESQSESDKNFLWDKQMKLHFRYEYKLHVRGGYPKIEKLLRVLRREYSDITTEVSPIKYHEFDILIKSPMIIPKDELEFITSELDVETIKII